MADYIDPFDPPKADGYVDPFDTNTISRPTQAAPAAATLERPGFVGSLKQGFQRALPETKSLLAGAGAAVAGAVGLDGLRDKALETYQEIQRDDVVPLQGDATFKGVMSGDDSFGEWAGDTIGNFGGQAVQSLAAAGVGAALGSAAPGAGTAGGAAAGFLARPVIKKMVGTKVAELLAKKGTLGAAAATTALNVGQETGIAYTGRAEDAATAGEQLTTTDALRAIAAGVPAGLLDTAAEAIGVGRLLKGASPAPKLTRRLAAGIAGGAVTEGATEGAQAVIERAGSARELTGQEAYDDYIENIAAGTLGGGVMGAGGGLRRQEILKKPGVVDPVLETGTNVPLTQPAAPTQAAPAPVVPVAAPTGQDYTPPTQGYNPAPIGYQPAPIGTLARVAERASEIGAVAPAASVPGGYLADPDAEAKARMTERLTALRDEQLGAPPAGMDPATGEVPAPQQAAPTDPAAIVNFLLVQGRNGSRMAGVSELVKVFRLPETEARALRKQALATLTEESKPPLNLPEPVDGQGDVSGAAPGAVPGVGSSSPAVAVQDQAGSPLAASAGDDQAAADNTGDRDLAVRAAEPAVADDAARPQAEGLSYDESEDQSDDDIGPASGGAFTIRDAADREAARRDGGRVFPVDGGFVVRVPRVSEAAAGSPRQDQPEVSTSAPTNQPETAQGEPLGTAEDQAGQESAPAAGSQLLPAAAQVAQTPAGNQASRPSADSAPTAGGVQAGSLAGMKKASATERMLNGMGQGGSVPVDRKPWTKLAQGGGWSDGKRIVSAKELADMMDRRSDVIEGEVVGKTPAWETAKVLRESPVGHVATVEGPQTAQHPDGGVRWTKQSNDVWTNGRSTITTDRLAKMVEGEPEAAVIDGQAERVGQGVIEGQFRRIEKQPTLPAPAPTPSAEGATGDRQENVIAALNDHPEKALGLLSPDEVRAVGVAIGKRFSAKASHTAIAARLSEGPRRETIAALMPAIQKVLGKPAAAPARDSMNGHIASGRAAFAEGKPRELPSYFTKPNNKNAKDFLRGWDDAQRAAEQPATPEPAATHADPGEQSEAVTPGIIRESLAKSADRTPLDLKQAKAKLMAQIGDALAKAVSSPTPGRRKGETNSGFQTRLDDHAKQVGFVTFDVPGDGKFKVLNTQEKLTVFRRQVELSKGFDAKGKSHPVPSRETLNPTQATRDKVMAEAETVDDALPKMAPPGPEATAANGWTATPAPGEPSNFVVRDETGKRVGSIIASSPEQAIADLARSEARKPQPKKKAEPSQATAANKAEGQPTSKTIDERIAEAEAAGVVLSDKDKATIRQESARADEFSRRANRLSNTDPMNKGNAFPMGVGFTTMTKRKSQAIDTSVRKAGEAVQAFGKAKAAQEKVDALLSGNGTGANIAERAEKKAASQESLMRKLLAGEKPSYGGMQIVKLTMDRDGYPSSAMLAGEGVIKGVNDKLDLASNVFGGKDTVRALVDKIRADQPAPSAEAPAATGAGTLDGQLDVMKRLADGTLSLDEYRAGFAALQAGRERILADLGKLTKDKLARMGGPHARLSDPKDRLVRSAYDDLVTDYNLSGTFTWNMRERIEDVMAAKVAAATEQTLQDYADKVAESRKAREQRVAGAKEPQTLSEFQDASRLVGGEANLTPEQRATFDRLRADARREDRDATAKRNAIVRQVDTGGTGMELVETKHTQKGHDLFVVKMAERVDGEVYKALNVAAKRLGGHYSSFRGNGAIPGFTFTTRDAAQQFMAVKDGNVDASGAQQARAEAKAESRAESLADKAAALRERGQASLSQERKANTTKRAGQAANAEAEARKQIALADTMAALAKAIEAGKAKMLAFVRHKSQVELLDSTLRAAHWDHLRAQGVDWEKAKETPLSADDLTNAMLPKFYLSRGDAIVVARRLMEARGGKAMGQSLAKEVDYGDEYGKAVQDNPLKFVQIKRGSQEGAEASLAFFSRKRDAEAAIANAKTGGFVVVKMPRAGKTSDPSRDWAVALSPDLAIERKLWAPDYDKKVSLSPTAAEKMLDVLRVSPNGDGQVPYWWHDHLAKRNQFAKLGIETNYELREALREYLALREQPAEEDRIRKLERSLIGRNVGNDFFPTPPAVVQRLIEQADIGPGMRVLEPSAGKGDIAEALRDASDDVTVDTVEMSSTLRELLEAKGFDTNSGDFLQFQSDPVYDRIVMNPPFGTDNGASHVRHAYSLLKPGGRLVAVMGAGTRGKAEFDAWLDKVGGLSEALPDGSFKSSFRPTGVATIVVEIDKPTSAAVLESTEAFYSSLAKTIEEAKGAPKRGSFGVWQGWLDGAVRRGEFKQAERDWLGLDDWIKGQDSVTREQLAEFVRANQVRVQDVVLSNEATDARLPPGWLVSQQGDADWEVWDADGEVVGTGATEQAARIDAMDPDERHDNLPAKFASYQLPGGENYRELLLTLPGNGGDLAAANKRLQESSDDMVLANLEHGAGSPEWQAAREANNRAAEEVEAIRGREKNEYRSSHFDQPNIVAHVRYNERTDADGKRVLFIEEIQSDFGQATRKSKLEVVRQVKEDFDGIVQRMKAAGVLAVECD